MASLTITASQVLLVSGSPIQGTWDSTVTAGKSVRYAPTTGLWGLAQCDNDATDAGYYGLGIALTGGGSGQQGLIAGPGCVVNLGAGAAAASATVYVAGATAGDIAPTADVTTSGNYRALIGVGIGSNKVKVALLDAAATAIP